MRDAFALGDPFELNSEMPHSILSPSSVSTFMRCPEQFRREYVLEQKRAPGGWAMSGSAFHEARHAALEYAMDKGEPVTLEILEVMYRVAWDKRLSEEEVVEWKGDTAEAVFERGWQMTVCYHETLGAEVRPIRMEYGAKGYVDGVPVPVYGRIDVEEAEEIIDTKTGRSLFHKLKPEHLVQGCIYVLLTGKPIRWHSVSEKPAAVTNDTLRLVPRPKVLEAARSYVRDSYEGIRDLLRTRGRDEEWPGTGPASGNCNYCSFRSRCKYVPD